MILKIVLAVLLPFVALGLQWLLWPWITPFVWFLFFPTVFFSARLGGYRGGLASTVLSAGIVWYFFIPPQLSWQMNSPSNIWSVGLFLFVGYLVSESQARLERANRETERALEETRTANEKITQLYQKTLELDELKSQFFANVSHELRTPLTLILNPIAGHLTAGGLEPGIRRDLEVVERNARLLYRHVTDLLDVSKLEAGHMPLNPEQTDLAHLTRVMASNFEGMARDRGIIFKVEAPADLPVLVDVEKMQRVLLNLLSNAFKFTPDGGEVGVTLNVTGNKTTIRVQDNGPGIPPSQREAIFEPFRQADGSATRRFGGTGLGLAIVQQFVALHDGTIFVTEAPGGGALFEMSLPLAAGIASPMPERTTKSEMDPELRRQALEELRPAVNIPPMPVAHNDAPLVLIVEDNADMNAYLSNELGRQYRVVGVIDGREGLERALALRPDLILADVMMPGMSGDEMALALRARPEMADVPIVMLTAKMDDALRVKLLRAGVQDYLTKPFDLDELLARVGGLLAERARTGERLQDSETRFEATFEQAAVGIAQVAPDGRWLRVNRKLCDIVGYSRAELLSRTFQDLTHPDDLNTDLEYVQRMIAREIDTYDMEKRCLRKDGGSVWINLTVALIWRPDGAPDYFIFVIEDIQARKQAEEELKQHRDRLEEMVRERTSALEASEARYRQLFEQAPDAVVLIDAETGALVAFNTRAHETLGYSRDEFRLLTLSDFEVIESPEEVATHIKKVQQEGNSVFETRHRTKTGDIRDIRVTVGVINVDGRIYLQSIWSDMTDRNQAEQAIRKLNTDLQRRQAELEAANNELEAFAYSVSHDLRSPLRGVDGYSRLLIEDHAEKLDEDALFMLGQVRASALQMGELIDNLLDFSRMGRREMRFQSCDVGRIVRDLFREMQEGHPDRRLRLELRELPSCIADAAMIREVVRNLLENAIKFTRTRDEAVIEIGTWDKGTRNGTAEFRDPDSTFVTYYIRDNGVGFDPLFQDKLFQVFQRLHRAEDFEGTGIGLALVQRIVHRHGGEVWAESQPDKGATFYFSLPGEDLKS